MSAMDIDRPLSDIIKDKAKPRRGGKRPSAGRTESSTRARYSGAVPKAASQPVAAVAAAQKAKAVTADAVKIIISNLPGDVTEAAVRDLMQSTVGPVKFVQMNYNSTGKSTGVATVLFKTKGDGNKAHTAYNNRMIDNQRPMKVEIIVDPNQIQSLASRVAPPPTAVKQAGAAAGAGAARGPRPARGRGGGRPRPARPAKKTAEELDAEMSAYKATGADA